MKSKVERLENLIKDSNEEIRSNLKIYLSSESNDFDKIKKFIRDLLGDVEISHEKPEYKDDILIFGWFEANISRLTFVVFYERNISDIIRNYMNQIVTKIDYDLKRADKTHRVKEFKRIKKFVEDFNLENPNPQMEDFKKFQNKMINLFNEEVRYLWAEKDIDFYIKYDDICDKELIEFNQFLTYLEDIEWLITEKSDFDFKLFSYPENEEEEE